MKSEKPSKTKLLKALVALKYEEDMLMATINALSSGLAGNNATVHNALVESFLIHARLLIEFLYRDKRYKDNIMAQDFFSHPKKWIEEIRQPKGDLLAETERDAHKYLAHLTRTRLLAKKKWDFNGIVTEIATRLANFRTHLPKDLLNSVAKSG